MWQGKLVEFPEVPDKNWKKVTTSEYDQVKKSTWKNLTAESNERARQDEKAKEGELDRKCWVKFEVKKDGHRGEGKDGQLRDERGRRLREGKSCSRS